MRKIAAFISFVVVLLLPPVVSAQETNGCSAIYNGGTSCEQEGSLTLDKKIRLPGTNQFVDHAEPNVLYSPDQPVVFQLTLRNTSSRDINDITITDILPQFVSYGRSSGKFDAETNTITIPVKKLAANQATTITVEGKTAAAGTLPDMTGLLCVVNQATARQGRNVSSDNSQFCLQKTALAQTAPNTPARPNAQAPAAPQTQTPAVQANPNVPVSPNTGPELLGLIGLLPAGAAGIFLRRKTTL